MNDTPKISVIVPVFKVEKYLARCIDSILYQSFQNLDIILVDDGSPDNCPLICDEYALKDSRVRVIHKKNGGLSSARNAALKEGVLGDYVAFVDSDDWLELDFFEYCYGLIKDFNADVVQVGVFITDSEEKKIPDKKEKVESFSGKEILQQLMIRSCWSACAALYNTKVLENILFRDGKINEDIDYKYRVLNNAQRMIFSNQKKYYYFQTGDTISMGGLKSKDFDLYEAAEELYKLTQNESYGKIRLLGEAKKARTAFSFLCKIAFYGIADPALNKHELIKKLTIEHRSNLKTLLRAPIPLSRKFLAVLFALNYDFSEKLIRSTKKLPGIENIFFK